jgi:hypothetical protein
MARKTERLKVPELKKPSLYALQFCRDNLEDLKADPDILIRLYETKNLRAARECLMWDLIYETCTDALEAPTSHRIQCRVMREFCTLTGVSDTTARSEFARISPQINRVANLGLMTNYAAAVQIDLLERMYEDLKTPKKKMSQQARTSLYKTMLEVADSITAMGTKERGNDINEDKNRILEKKVDSDTKIGIANVALQYNGATREEKERMAVEALLSDKTVLNPVLDMLGDGTF